MDFLDPSKKRQHRIKLIIGYVLIAIAISLVTAILVFQSYGYDLDRKTGAIIQNGLLFVSAQPVPADVYLNGKQYKSQSDARLVLPSDVYKMELKNNGYRTWTRTVSLAGGTIERFVYPFMFPNNLTSKAQKTYTNAPTLTTQSLDRHWLLVEKPGELAVFDQFDANDSKKAPTTLTVPEALFATSTQHTLKVVEWSSDNRHFLLQDDYQGGRDFIMVDRETPSSSYNVNKTFAVSLSQVTMRDKSPDQLYLYDQTSRKLNIGDSKAGTVKPLLANVLAYKSHGSDLVLYATDDKATPGKSRVMLRDNDGSYLIREVTASPTILLNLAQYSNHWYMAAGSAADGAAFVYKDPQDTIKSTSPTKPTLPITALRIANPNWLEYSANTQFLTMQSGSQFATYDFENQRSYKYDIKLPIDDATAHATWMDGNRLIVNSQSKMVVFDYDGTNLQTLSDNKAGLLPVFDRQYRLMYTFAPAKAGAAGLTLNRLNLVVGQNN